jgi:hypothetical protein
VAKKKTDYTDNGQSLKKMKMEIIYVCIGAKRREVIKRCVLLAYSPSLPPKAYEVS